MNLRSFVTLAALGLGALLVQPSFAATKIFPADFTNDETIQDAINSMAQGDLLEVAGYRGSDTEFRGGLNNSVGITIKATSAQPLVFKFLADGDGGDFINNDKGVLNHNGGTIENFVFEADWTNYGAGHDIVFAGDFGGYFKNCTFRAVGNWKDGDLIKIYGGNDGTGSEFTQCVFESTATDDLTGDDNLIHISDPQKPIFRNCTIKGRGIDHDGLSGNPMTVMIFGGMPTFNDCLFDNNRGSVDTIWMEGDQAGVILNRSTFQNPTRQDLRHTIFVNAGGGEGPAKITATNCRFLAGEGSTFTQMQGTIFFNRKFGSSITLNGCVIHWASGYPTGEDQTQTGGHPDGGVLVLQETENSVVTMQNCTVYDIGSASGVSQAVNGREIQLQGANPGLTFNLTNNIFAPSTTNSDGIIFNRDNAENPGVDVTVTGSNNLRFRGAKGDARGSIEMTKLPAAFTEADPMLEADHIHLAAGSPAINAGVRVRGNGRDIDATPRPQAGAMEIGADEIDVGDAIDVLYIGTGFGGDPKVIERLEWLGAAVTFVAHDTPPTAANAEGMDLIVASGTSGSGNIGGKFKDVAVPMLDMEAYVYDNMMWTGPTPDTDFGFLNLSAPDQTQLQMVAENADHALAAGLTGIVTVTTGVDVFNWANPVPSAIKIATRVDHPEQTLLFGIEKDAVLFDGTTAAERAVGFFFYNDTANQANDTAWTLFDASVGWLTRGLLGTAPVEIPNRASHWTLMD